MKRWSFLFLGGLLLAILLAACGGEVALKSTSISQATTTIIPPSETPNPKQEYLPTYQAKMTQWATEKDTNEDVAIAVRTNTPTRGPTRTPYPTATIPQQTLAARATLGALIAQNPDLEQLNWAGCSTGNCYMPEGLWAAFLIRTEDWVHGIKIISTDGTKQWEVYFTDLSDQPCPCAESYVGIKHWSHDGKYVYIYPINAGSGGDILLWRDLSTLFRFDLETGQWRDTHISQAASFSPNDRYIVYRSESNVYVYEFKTGQERVFPVSSEFVDFGRFEWSPDSSKIIFVATREWVEYPVQTGFTGYIIDLTDDSVSVIFKDDLRFLYPYYWKEQNQIILENIYDGYRFQLDLKTNEITPME
ncbi:MAG: hypothetical protein JXB38_09405 [Anaerolineales bacterium]|nr:hypothetical protein [Anaerolineales bacterium]